MFSPTFSTLGLLLALSAPLPLFAITLPIPSGAWTGLNTTVHGRLVQGIPYARSCFPHVGPGVGGTFNAAQCATIQADYLVPEDIESSLGGYINTQWETCQAKNQQCVLNNTNPADPVPTQGICSQGSVAEFGINVATASDVLAGFAFSESWGIPLVVKNTGHEYKGRSSGPGTLAIWTHNLKGITHTANFVPTGCPAHTATSNAVTVGAGVVYEDLIAFADTNHLTLPAGGCGTVGAAGGYPQGGGHSMFSNVYGLGADRVLEMEVVTPRGDHLIANSCQNTDLFWALRGGGGGTFGVVLKLTTMAFPATTVSAVFATVDATVPGQAEKFFQFMTENALGYAQQGFGYYLYPFLPAIVMSNTILSFEEAQASLAPLMNLITHNFTGTGNTWQMTLEPNYLSYYDKYVTIVPIPVGTALTVASHLIPVSQFQTASGRSALVQAMTDVVANAPISIAFGVAPFLHGNKNDTSVNPAWYDSLWHFAIGNTWNFNQNSTTLKTIYSDLSSAINPFRALAPSSGAYQNEADVYEPNFSQSFWGSNYQRLLSIKQKYDPHHLLDCWQCVGWKGSKDARYSCYIDVNGI
ncbi:FAD-binding domain-containing protein [Roridomyces roridus]|uniref:FAD-binding domain-containing protein n=1 Tax=Roridomyces roridus TaxID=1738132 RepID=A0AAD7BD62_9AGAR|nr:FAD-binding domain-containing protein [Roridomyces roridus]